MSRVAQVNTTDIAAAIQLGCRTMQRVFNADAVAAMDNFGADLTFFDPYE